MWFLYRKVILTKDNLAKRNWTGNKCCSFCDIEELIQHLFFECPFAKLVWRMVHVAHNITPPKNISRNWLHGIEKKELKLIRVGVCAVLWAMWNVRNDFVFNKPKKPSFLQVIPLTTHWIHSWSYLQPVELRQVLDSGCTRLETVAKDFYNRSGWRFEKRIAHQSSASRTGPLAFPQTVEQHQCFRICYASATVHAHTMWSLILDYV